MRRSIRFGLIFTMFFAGHSLGLLFSQMCPEGSCDCFKIAGAQVLTATCSAGQFCGEKDGKPLCQASLANEEVCQNPEGCPCKAQEYSTYRPEYGWNAYCQKGEACYSTGKNAVCGVKKIVGSETCDDSKSCVCLHEQIFSSRCLPGQICRGYMEMANCFDKKIGFGVACNSDSCLCEDSEISDWKTVVTRGQFCGLERGTLRVADKIIHHSQTCDVASGYCYCVANEGQPSRAAFCASGSLCLVDSEIEPAKCSFGKIAPTQVCKGPEQFCQCSGKISDGVDQTVVVGRGDTCFVFPKQLGGYSKKIILDQTCDLTEGQCLCQVKAVDNGDFAICPPFSKCASYIDNSFPGDHLRARCRILTTYSNHYCAEGLCMYAAGYNKPSVFSCEKQKVMSIVKNQNLCLPSVFIGQKCNSKSCACFLSYSAAIFDLKPMTFCEETEYCLATGRGLEMTCTKTEMTRSSDVNSDRRFCYGPGDKTKAENIAYCDLKATCSVINNKPICAEVVLETAQACTVEKGCFCGADQARSLCRKGDYCMIDNGVSSCVSDPLRTGNRCFQKEGCLCLRNRKAKEEPVTAFFQKCKLGQFCLTVENQMTCLDITPIGKASVTQPKDQAQTNCAVNDVLGVETISCPPKFGCQVFANGDLNCVAPAKRQILGSDQLCYNTVAGCGCAAGKNTVHCDAGEVCKLKGSDSECVTDKFQFFLCKKGETCRCGAVQNTGNAKDRVCSLAGDTNTFADLADQTETKIFRLWKELVSLRKIVASGAFKLEGRRALGQESAIEGVNWLI